MQRTASGADSFRQHSSPPSPETTEWSITKPIQQQSSGEKDCNLQTSIDGSVKSACRQHILLLSTRMKNGRAPELDGSAPDDSNQG
ncbi:hypothetical protein PoB_006596100 [Plakobranchus ocellatus]|uniref:Uncharacterized protein n=1 Tax=Plakobranchus ocellatus TaxID=259542 RepID=A0AAV4D5W2_9GAST|nr:hypothetical protein PoB_006596100 [Plakobranchus ocellatus]